MLLIGARLERADITTALEPYKKAMVNISVRHDFIFKYFYSSDPRPYLATSAASAPPTKGPTKYAAM